MKEYLAELVRIEHDLKAALDDLVSHELPDAERLTHHQAEDRQRVSDTLTFAVRLLRRHRFGLEPRLPRPTL